MLSLSLVQGLLKGSWGLVAVLKGNLSLLIAPIEVLKTVLIKYHEPPSSMGFRSLGLRYRAPV